MRTLKCEEVYLHTYRDHALLHIQHFLERVYNRERLHSALDYVAPAAYERALESQRPAALRAPAETLSASPVQPQLLSLYPAAVYSSAANGNLS